MKTDVFPKEDSVRVVWAPFCDCQECKKEGASYDWKVKSRSKRAGQDRFSVTPCGRLDGGSDERCCDASASEDNCGADYIERRGIEGLQAYGHADLSSAYFDGLMDRPKTWDHDAAQRLAYQLGCDEAQLIDWQA